MTVFHGGQRAGVDKQMKDPRTILSSEIQTLLHAPRGSNSFAMLAASTWTVKTVRHSLFTASPRCKRTKHGSRRHISSTTSRRTTPLDDTITLDTGRTLGYHTSGPPTGTPVLYIHGNPDSGIQVTGSLESKVAQKMNIRWIGPDRPGVGLSSPSVRSGHEIIDYPDDIQALVAHLGLKRYYILGTSGGTGYTLSCAKSLPRSQLQGVGICAGIGPIELGFSSMGALIKTAWDLWRDSPEEMRDYIERTYTHLARASDTSALRARFEEDFKSYLTGKDLEHLLQKDVLDSAVEGYRQIYAQGAGAHARGIAVNQRPWGFRLEDVAFPGIRLWYGSEDVNTTPAMGRYMADRLDRAVYREFEGRSHFTIWDEELVETMLEDLVGSAE
jgi:pimeloyl-ACP methyl ester carboxylesterase